MAKDMDKEMTEARHRFQVKSETEPWIENAAYSDGRLVLQLKGSALEGTTLSFPLRSIPELAHGTDEQLAALELTRRGNAVLWRGLDVGISAKSLVELAIGLRSVSSNAAKAGSTRSEAKAVSARENGCKGGRPRKADKVAVIA